MKRSITLATTAVILAAVLLVSCHSTKQATTTVKDSVDVRAAGSMSTTGAEHLQWLSTLSLDIDSPEIIITELPFPMNGKEASRDTAAAVSAPNPSSLVPSPASNARIILRGKRASIGKADIIERNASRSTHRVDSVSTHRSIDANTASSRDTTAITKPPDGNWVAWLIIAGILAQVSLTEMRFCCRSAGWWFSRAARVSYKFLFS